MTKHNLLLTSIFFLLIINQNSFSQKTNQKQDSFKEPVNFPIYLSGTFGELRSNHFHSGIDIKTDGVTGKKITGIADGYVSRIKVSPSGYGRTLYINHPKKGYTSVYAHLDRFNNKLEKYVTNEQYKNKTFPIQLFPEAEQFTVKKGQLIGYSGNSGSSQGPHLHFEIRKIDNQHPVNPMRFDFQIEDQIAPKVFLAAVYPINKNSRIKGKNEKYIFSVKQKDKINYYRPENNKIIKVRGKIGFGIKTFDFLNGSHNWCGVNSIKLYIDDKLWYHHKLDEFSFSESRYINSLIDYEEKILRNSSVQKLFLEPNNQLSIYNFIRNNGVVELNDTLVHNVKYIIQDTYKNESILEFSIKNVNNIKEIPSYSESNTTVFPYNEDNEFKKEGIKLTFPSYAFYDTVHFEYKREEPIKENIYSDIHYVHKKTTPVHKYFNLSIKTNDLPPSLSEKAFIAYKNGEDSEYEYTGGEKVNGYITTKARKLGKYCIMTDTVAPVVKAKRPEEIVRNGVIKIQVEDDLSGIKTYNGYIDNEWALFEYDPKNNLILYKIDRNRLKKSEEHELELYVGDNMNNITTFYTRFKL